MTILKSKPQRIALVTGGTGGIGTAICRQLADDGFRVVANYVINEEAALRWQTEQRQKDYDFDIIYGDVSNFDSSGEMIKSIESTIGPIDILLNTAGIIEDVVLKKMTLEQWQKVLHVDLDSVFNVTRHVINSMIDRGYGRIISISSVNAQMGSFGQTNYSAAKAGILGFSKALAREVATKGITVNTITPGFVETEMVKKIPENILKNIVDQIPLKRLAQPEEIAYAISFLASEKAGYITGANIAINGGLFIS